MTLDNLVFEICFQRNFHIRALRHVRPTLSRNTAATLACHIRALRHVRPTLARNTPATLACSIVQSRLDYCNSVFYGMSESNVEQLKTIQNKLARVVCGDYRLRSSKDMLMILHWLPVRSRIQYKHSQCSRTKRSTWDNQCISVMNLLERFVHRAHFSCRCRQYLRRMIGGHSVTLSQRFGHPSIWTAFGIMHRNVSAQSKTSFFSNSLDSHDTWTRKLVSLKSSFYSYEKLR